MTSESGLRPAFSCAPGAVVIGGGPAGLMAAEVLAESGVEVDVFDAMPSVGRKFLLAGKGGLNLTHSEALDVFVGRYRERAHALAPVIRAFGPAALRDWAQALGVDTFVGTSGRVFPRDMKAAPLLRAWLHRLRHRGVRFHMRHRWGGWDAQGHLRFDTPVGQEVVSSHTTVLALGGGSWARLGSDGAWVPRLQARGVSVRELQPSNCGFDVGWSAHFASRYAGAPMKNVAITWRDPTVDFGSAGALHTRQGEFVITEGGIEGSLVYAASAALREGIARQGQTSLTVDLLPGRTSEAVAAALAHPRGTRSLATHLKSRLGLDGVKRALIHECLPREVVSDDAALARALKAVPVTVKACRPIDEAISSAGGVCFEALDEHLMLRALPGVFCAGEMLDWEAPTGGYLLTACMASGRVAGQGALRRWRCRQAAGAAERAAPEPIGRPGAAPDAAWSPGGA